MFRLIGIFIVLTIGCSLGRLAPVTANEAPKQTTENQPSAAQGAASAAGGEKASGLVKKTPKGQLKNPYQDFAKVTDEGHKKYMSAGCDGCHGGTGGGSMCPSLTGHSTSRPLTAREFRPRDRGLNSCGRMGLDLDHRPRDSTS